MRWRKGLRNGDRENGGAWRGDWVENEGGQAMESLGTGAREERLEAKERVENRKEKRSFFIKSCTKKSEI